MIYGGLFDVPKKNERLKELESLMSAVNFWDDKKRAEEVISELNSLKELVVKLKELKKKIATDIDLVSELEFTMDQDIFDMLEIDCKEVTD